MAESLNLPGYQIESAPFYTSRSTHLFKGIKEGEKGQEVVVKLSVLQATLKQNERLRLEYQLAAQLNQEPLVVNALDCLPYEHSYALVFEYLPFPSLKDVLAEKKKLPVLESLMLGINIAKALQAVHDKDIIHKDINPANILCDLSTQTIKLIDFSSAINLPKEYASLHVKHLEGTLAYLAPEQSGRMNRGIDYRCDHYSLGVTLYHMLTGTLPFKGQDALEILYQHMVIAAKPPHEVDANIPEVVSDIVMKLMKKTCEERYQSLYGLIYDLEKCLRQLEEKGSIEPFSIASQDRYHRFQIPEKLYGREAEVNTLMQAYKQAIMGEASLMLVAGEAGIGKTALVHEIYKPIIRERGYFISGKFEQFKRYLPFSALSHAFDALVEQIINEDFSVVRRYKEAILDAVGNQGQLLIDIIPNLKIILGAQPPVSPVSSDRAKDRLAYVFNQFLHALNWVEHPLVIFLDDVQWIDDASLNLLKELLTAGEEQYLLFIAAYRSNEVDVAHPFMKSVADLRQNGIKVHEIALYPLGIESVQALLSDALYQSREKVAELAHLCQSKTAGNPFFLNQLLLTFVQEKLITFNSKNNLWSWQLAKIKSHYVSPNVVDLLTKKLHQLSDKTQRLLQYAACIGTHFDLNLLAALNQDSELVLTPLLEEAQREGFIQLQAEAGWQFSHDRIQQAALILMAEEAQKETHLRLARFLLQDSTEQNLDAIIFTLLEHYNAAIELILEPAERGNLARLNLKASQLSKASGAYAAAFNFMEKALSCVEPSLWKTNYPLMFELYTEAIESAYLSAHYEKVDVYASLCLQQVENQVDKLKIMEIQIRACSSQLKMEQAIGLVEQAINFFREAFLSIGIAFPKKITSYHLLIAFLKAHWCLSRKDPLKLLEQGEMQNPVEKALILLLVPTLNLTYHTAPNTWALIICLSALYCMKHGNGPGVASIYAALGIIEVGFFNAIPQGIVLSELAKGLNAKFPNEGEKALVKLVGSVYLHHKAPIQMCIAEGQAAFELCFSQGDFINAFNIASLKCFYSVYSDQPIQEIQSHLDHYLVLAKKTKQFHAEEGFTVHLVFLYQLQVKTEHPWNLNFKNYNGALTLKHYQSRKEISQLAGIYFLKLILGVIFEAYPKAWKFSLIFESYQQGLLGTYYIPRFYFYQALISLQLLTRWNCFNPKHRRRIFRSMKKLRGWAKHAPCNYQHMVFLLKAEYASKIKKKSDEARRFYDLAIAGAKENRFLSDEAIANELAAKHFLAEDWLKLARLYMQEARSCYNLWGATAKVMQLEERYPHLFKKEEDSRRAPIEITSTQGGSEDTTLNISSELDLKTIIKAARALPSTLILKDLLQKLMRMLIENVGAEKCMLLLEKEGSFLIEAEQNTVDATAGFLQSFAMSEDKLPLSVVRNVINGKKVLLINEALETEPYSKDPYVLKNQIKSILCLPLIKKGALYGVLYLENNSTGASFSKERLDLLKLLLGQITISIDNAQLYGRTLALNAANERFVPFQFLSILNRSSITEVVLGDHAEQTMSVMFLDIRDFTSISERMTPEENFEFINGFLSVMAPVIRDHHGIIDKYIGDAIMAIFPGPPEQALECALALMAVLKNFNQTREEENKPVIRIGIGINTGKVMVGMLGESNRMNATVISDDVNLASRVESLSKDYPGTPIIVTQNTVSQLKAPLHFKLKKLGQVKVKGKEQVVDIWGMGFLS